MNIITQIGDLFSFLEARELKESLISEILRLFKIFKDKKLIYKDIDLEAMSVGELKDYCKDNEIRGFSGKKRGVLIKHIKSEIKKRQSQEQFNILINLSEEEVEFIIFKDPIEEGYKELVDRVYFGKVYNSDLEYLEKPYTRIEMLRIVKEHKDKEDKELMNIFQQSPIVKTGEQSSFYYLEALLSAELVFHKKGLKSPIPFGIGESPPELREYKRLISDITKEIENKIVLKLSNIISEVWEGSGKSSVEMIKKIKEESVKKGITLEDSIREDILDLNVKNKDFFHFQVYFILKRNSIKLSKGDLVDYANKVLLMSILKEINN